MREILLVSVSALLGYIVFSAFSTSATPQEAMQKIIQQPHTNPQVQQELAFNKLRNQQEAKLIELQNQHRLEELRTYQHIAIKKNENDTKVELKEIDAHTTSTIASMKYASENTQKERESHVYIFISVLIFILIFIYLKYQKSLVQKELESEKEYKALLAKKEYAEKILTLLATGNLSFETEQKLLKVLDELNGKELIHRNGEIIYHPNPDIGQIPTETTFLK